MTGKTLLKADPLPWLLAENGPGVRYLALRDLLDRPADDPQLAEARRAAHRAGPIAAVLAQMDAAGFWAEPGPGYYPKYRGSVWAVILLAQLGAASSEDERIGRACAFGLAELGAKVLLLDRDAAGAERYVRDAFAGFEVEIVDLAVGARPGLDAPLAQEFVAAVGAVPRPKYGWTDVARFSALGIPALNFGPGDPLLAHKADERCPVRQIEQVHAALRAWLDAVVVRDAVCGCARHVAEGLIGVSADDAEQEAGLLHHHYPCLASMGIDGDYGDTLMHISGNLLKNNIGPQVKPFRRIQYIIPGQKSD